MSSIQNHPYKNFLQRLKTPSRYVGGEFGSAKPPKNPEASVVLAFPDVYEVGMSHLGTQILYRLLADTPGIQVERCFSPWPDLEEALRQHKLPLVSLESHSSLSQFDVIGVSMQHELCFTNILNLLNLSGVPLRAKDRLDNHPIVLGGGPTAHHPEPVAPFFDAIFIGEAEETLPGVVLEIGRRKKAGRQAVLQYLASIPGFYVPSLYKAVPNGDFVISKPLNDKAPETVQRVYLSDLDAFPTPSKTIVPWNRAVFDRVSMEIARGCTEGCRFCEAGYTYRPLRDRSPEAIFQTTLEAIDYGGFEEVSLGSLSPADYPALGPLVHALSGTLTPKHVTLSVSSLRAYGLQDQTLKDLKAVRMTGLTMAPEAGSQRLRDVINKNISEADLLESARRAFSNGWQRLKLYFMIGLPTETDDDVDAIVQLAGAVQKLGRGIGRATVNVSVGVFVPRPHTPFQWEGMASPDEIARKIDRLKDAARQARINLKYSDGVIARLECAMARGDHRMADVIERAYHLGCRFDDWSEHNRADLWQQAFAEVGIDWDKLTGQISKETLLPWEIVDVGVKKAFLAKERALAMDGKTTHPCEKPKEIDGIRPGPAQIEAAKTVVCHGCGVGCVPNKIALARSQVVKGARSLPVFVQDQEDRGGYRDRDGDRDGAVHDSEPQQFELWHLIFSKTGPASFLSQTDLVKHLPRILRRAGLTLKMSGGFHPLPKITYREPMPVGYQSIGEWLDVWLAPHDVALDAKELIDRLNDASVEGIQFLFAKQVEGKRQQPKEIKYAFESLHDLETTQKLLQPLLLELLPEPSTCPILADWPNKLASKPIVLVWPRGANLPNRPHETLSLALDHPFLPSDLVRLYDDPRGLFTI